MFVRILAFTLLLSTAASAQLVQCPQDDLECLRKRDQYFQRERDVFLEGQKRRTDVFGPNNELIRNAAPILGPPTQRPLPADKRPGKP